MSYVRSEKIDRILFIRIDNKIFKIRAINRSNYKENYSLNIKEDEARKNLKKIERKKIEEEELEEENKE